MRYAEDFVMSVTSGVEIGKVIGKYVDLVDRGNVMVGKSPFGEGDIIVFKEKNAFFCPFSPESGNSAYFLSRFLGIPFNDAVKQIADEHGIAIPEDAIIKDSTDQLRAKLARVNLDAFEFYRERLSGDGSEACRKYIEKRGLSRDTVDRFGIGYAPDGFGELYKHLRKKGYSDSLLLKSGLVREKNGHFYDLFRNRIMFPVRDDTGVIVAFGGRVLDDSKPKYLNLPETPLFDKSQTLFGLDISKNSKKNYLLLCEGYMDTVSLHQAGFDNAVAALGTAITSTHGPLITKYKGNVVVALDSDGPGRAGTERAIRKLLESDVKIRVLDMSPCKDPDEFIKSRGKEEFNRRIRESDFYETFLVKQALDGYEGKSEKEKEEAREAVIGILMEASGKIGEERIAAAARTAEEIVEGKEWEEGEEKRERE